MLSTLLEKINDHIPLYTEDKLQRNVNRKLKEKKWWGVNHDSVLFVQATPGEALKREFSLFVISQDRN